MIYLATVRNTSARNAAQRSKDEPGDEVPFAAKSAAAPRRPWRSAQPFREPRPIIASVLGYASLSTGRAVTADCITDHGFASGELAVWGRCYLAGRVRTICGTQGRDRAPRALAILRCRSFVLRQPLAPEVVDAVASLRVHPQAGGVAA